MKTVTKESNKELFKTLRNNCDYDTSHIPKHGMGRVHVQSEDNEGNLYECYAEWDYSNGIEWEYDMIEWYEVNEHENICPCCGQEIN